MSQQQTKSKTFPTRQAKPIKQWRIAFTTSELVNDRFEEVEHSTKWTDDKSKVDLWFTKGDAIAHNVRIIERDWQPSPRPK